MASHPDTVQFIADQVQLGDALTHKRMFGEYALYLHGKVVAFVCDDLLYLKPTAEGRAFLGQVQEAPPYPGGKPHFLLTTELDQRDRLREALRITEAALPSPQPRKPRVTTAPAPARRAPARSAKK